MLDSVVTLARSMPSRPGIGALSLLIVCGCLGLNPVAIASDISAAQLQKQPFEISPKSASTEYSVFDAAFDQTEGSLSSTFSASNNSHLQQLTRLETAWA